MLKRFLHQAGGAVAPLFAIAAIPMLGAAGAAVDFSIAYQQRTIVQDALDAAALSGGRKIGAATNEQIKAEVEIFYYDNIGEKIVNPPPLVMTVAGGTITLNTTLHVPTYFLRIMGLDEIVFHMMTAAKAGMGTIEVVMALDNSGSMSGSKISTLRDAATDLTNKLFALETTSTQPEPVKIGLVPFAAAVNVGPQYANAAWMDTGNVNPYHADALKANGSPSTVNNLTLFSGLKDSSNDAVTWGGCVEERPMPYDASDDPASPGTPGTMFVPLLAPDEPDNWTCSTTTCSYAGSWSSRRYNGAPSGSRSYNNYLPDAGTSATCGSASSTNANWTCQSGSANCGGGGTGRSEASGFAGLNISGSAMCKYGTPANKATVSNVSVGGIPAGPNFMCTTPALQPLTTNKDTVLAKINEMQAQGATNILSGAAWGWRLLSPGEPFTEGRTYDYLDNNKFLILMTDGANTYYPKTNSSLLKSWYGAFGYVAQGHLGTTSTNANTLADEMNERTIQACTNMKAMGVVIYTVGFDFAGMGSAEEARALEVVTECASGPDKYFTPDSDSDLLAAFTAIGDSITSLRVAM